MLNWLSRNGVFKTRRPFPRLESILFLRRILQTAAALNVCLPITETGYLMSVLHRWVGCCRWVINAGIAHIPRPTDSRRVFFTTTASLFQAICWNSTNFLAILLFDY